ncbi:MAG: TldD/PmbA family protein [Acidimicrobiales bacterium]
MTSHRIDPDFAGLPFAALSEAALSRASGLGADHVELHLERLRQHYLRLKDGAVEAATDLDDLGLSVRVITDGTIGFASGVEVSPDGAARAAAEAVQMAKLASPANRERVELAGEPSHPGVMWSSSYGISPYEVDDGRKVAVLEEWSRQLLASPVVDHVEAALEEAVESKFYADSGGTTVLQERVRVHPVVEVVSVDARNGTFDTMRTLGPPAGRGYEYLTGAGWDFSAEIERLPELLAEKAGAASVEAGRYDLVIDPTNLWLTIHESIGHATELDRALGYEAAYAGTSFATPELLGELEYGSPLMTVTGDRTVEHGLATVACDDEGVEAQAFELVTRGILAGYQLDRQRARAAGLDRSNGCAYASSPRHAPLQRMANVSLKPDPTGGTTEQLIAGVEDGIYIVGDKSWSIDMQRYNFQFTGQRFYRIRSGRLAEPLRDVAYQATTTDFWRSLAALGGPATYVLGGAFNCGKGQPGQAAPVSHGCPSALFTGVRVLNASRETAR